LQEKEIRKTTSEVLRKTQHVTAEYTEELTEGYSLLYKINPKPFVYSTSHCILCAKTYLC
jgi:hypothetical protein